MAPSFGGLMTLSLSYLQVLLGRLRPGPRVEGDETDGLQIERERQLIAHCGLLWDVMPPSLEAVWV